MKTENKTNQEQAVLITGASTGIGYATAIYLDQMGYKVYACVRKEADKKNLQENSSDRLETIILDVTDNQSIMEAVAYIESDSCQLKGLVNNAGIGLGGALELTPQAEIEKVINVNIVGLLSVTKAFLPMLRESKGRIINIGSTASYLPGPGASVYSGTKFAVRAITDSLRVELHHFGIKAILVSPGATESAIWNKGESYRKELRSTCETELSNLYKALIQFGDSLYKDMKRTPAVEVAKSIHKALSLTKPKRYYIVGKDAKGAKKATRFPKSFLENIILKKIKKFDN